MRASLRSRLGIAALITLLPLLMGLYLPVVPYTPECVHWNWYSWPPRMHPLALSLTSQELQRAGWRHMEVAGRILMPAFQLEVTQTFVGVDNAPEYRNLGWPTWIVQAERDVLSTMINRMRRNGTASGHPMALQAALTQSDRRWREATPSTPQWPDHALYAACSIQRAALFDADLATQAARCAGERNPRLGWCR